jgi:hypothetical protein
MTDFTDNMIAVIGFRSVVETTGHHRSQGKLVISLQTPIKK